MPLLAEPVELAQAARTDRGILAVANPLPPGWERGITFDAAGCSEPEVVDPCTVLDSAESRPDIVQFDAVLIRQNSACSTLSQLDHENRADDRLSATTEWALGHALAVGTGSVNPSFADATTVHAGAGVDLELDVLDAVSCLEQAIADTGFGARAMLHSSPRGATYLRRWNLIDDMGRSPAGHRWVISPGYPAADDTVTLWATGTVWAAVNAPVTLRNPDWRRNTDAAYRQREGLAAFDPCLNLASTFPVTTCSGGS